MKKPEPDFGPEDLLSTLTEMLSRPEEQKGMTTKEMAERLGCHIKRVRELLGNLHKQGRLKRQRVYRESFDGTMRTTNAYTVIESDGDV